MIKQSILVIDDDQFSRTIYADILSDEGYDVIQVSGGKEALRIIDENHIGLVLTDMVMPDFDGMEIIQKVKQKEPAPDVIVITASSSVHLAVTALKGGASDYLIKPVNPEELKILVKRCFEQKRLFAENSELKGFIRLFESSQRISSCLDKEALYDLSLDALLRETETKKGIILTNESGEKPEIKVARGIKQIDAKTARALLESATGKDLASLNQSRVIDLIEPVKSIGTKALKKLSEALLMPLQYRDNASNWTHVGFLVLFKEMGSEPFSATDHNHAAFLEKQIALAFENAEKFVDAKELAYIDDLTGCYNSRYLEYYLNKEIDRCKSTKGQFSVLFLDLDYFKQVNDIHGHLIGGKLLVEVAKVVENCVRTIDVVTRYGGDEFTIILTNTDSGGALKVAERIRSTLENHQFLSRENLGVRVTSCIGIASYPEHAKTVDDIIHMADLAMYRGKKTTRNVVYVASMLSQDELSQDSPTPLPPKNANSST